MIASFVDADGTERAFDIGCLGDFQSLLAEAGTSVLLEHENGSSLAFSASPEDAFLVWTDPMHYVYSWHGVAADALDCVRAYVETGWPSAERVRFTHDGT